MIDVVEEVAEGRARIEWSTVTAKHKDLELAIYVFRDAAKFDGIPALRWDFTLVPPDDVWHTAKTFDGVRLPASALQLQKIADLTGSMLLTPKVIDLLWIQAGLKFNPVINTPSYPGAPSNDVRIVATSHIHLVHQLIEEKIAKLGGDNGKLVSCVGKYWCLHQSLAGHTKHGTKTACNYGWPSPGALYLGVTPGIKVWQGPGFRHDHHHWDPSQTIRLMYRKAALRKPWSTEIVDLYDVATDPALAPLIAYDGKPLTYLRQAGEPIPANSIAMPMYAPSIPSV